MVNFSERYRYKPVRTALGQYESMDNGLRVAIWNFYKQDDTIRLFNSQIAYSFLRIPVGNGLSMILDKDDEIQERFFKLEWNEVYDFVEFCMRMRKKQCNK